MRRPGEGSHACQLLDGAWDIAFESRSNVVDVYVRYLREKIDRPFGADSLETVRGVGYRLQRPREPPADPTQADAAVRARDGRRPRRAGRVRLRARRRSLLSSIDQSLRAQAHEGSTPSRWRAAPLDLDARDGSTLAQMLDRQVPDPRSRPPSLRCSRRDAGRGGRRRGSSPDGHDSASRGRVAPARRSGTRRHERGRCVARSLRRAASRSSGCAGASRRLAARTAARVARRLRPRRGGVASRRG